MTIYAEDINYWKTSKSSPDMWIDRAKHQIEQLGGKILIEGFGSESMTGRTAFILSFELSGNEFKIIWPVLPNKTDNNRAAKIQAATMLYHDVKAKCISSAVLGSRAAFFSFLVLPDGRTVTEAAIPELVRAIPNLFRPAISYEETK